MIGLIIITHGNLAIELKSSLEHIIGPQKNLETISIGYEDDVNKRKDEIKELINKVDTGKGVILLTDMFGNTPSNLVISLIEENPSDTKSCNKVSSSSKFFKKPRKRLKTGNNNIWISSFNFNDVPKPF